MEIDHDGETPIYLQLAAILRAQIASGELAPGRPIPSEKSLMQQYGGFVYGGQERAGPAA